MFTGIIAAIGQVTAMQKISGDLRLTISSAHLDWTDVQLGDSIATNGTCLTAVKLLNQGFVADVSVETLQLTTIGQWQVGQPVNLEKALTPQSRLGGHIVSGHVDGLGEVLERHQDARSERFRLSAPASLAKYIAHKGSITVDGTSLTVNKVDGVQFELNIVPHTLKHTIMDSYRQGTQVNLEVDVIARYLERLLMGDQAAQPQTPADMLSEAFLAEHGYLK